MPGTAGGDFFRNEYEMNYLLKISKVPSNFDLSAIRIKHLQCT